MEYINLYDVLFDIAVTWSIGLSPPLIIRYVIIRGEISKHPALLICFLFMVFNLFLFSILGSQSKTHAVLFVIAGVSYAILRKNTTKTDLSHKESHNHRVNLLHSRSVNWSGNFIHRQSWRIIASFTPLFLVCPFLAFYYSVDTANANRIEVETKYRSPPESKRLLLCANKPEVPYKSYTEYTSKDWDLAFQSLEYNQNCTVHEQELLKDFGSIFFSHVSKLLPPFLLVGLFLYLALFATSLVISEQHIGWRRVSIVISLAASPTAGAAYYFISDNSSYEEKLVHSFIVSVVLFVASLIAIILTRRIYLWVRAGFAGD